SGTTTAEPVETTFARISHVECGPDQSVFVDISIGNSQGVLAYSVFSTWASVTFDEMLSAPLPQLIEKRIRLTEPIDTVDRDHEIGLVVEIPENSTLIYAYATEPTGRCPGHYQEQVEMAPSDPIAPLVNVTQNTNCRRGPSLEYDVLFSLLSGQTAEITGRNADSSWWQIDPGLGGRVCWIAGSVVQINGDVSDVAVVAAPPLPVITNTPTPTPTPTPTLAPPVDNTPPSFYNIDVSPDSILTEGNGCPSYDRTTTVAASVGDEGGLSSVVAYWNIGAAESGQVSMTEGTLGYWAVIGPVNTTGTMEVYMIAQDTAGNAALSGTLYVTVQNCIQ
ncbi:MAG: hypothetical protein ACC645_12570, partial [Pirellulales bacterium]